MHEEIDAVRLRQDVIKKVFSNNSDFRPSSDRVPFADNRPLLAGPANQELQHRPPFQASEKALKKIHGDLLSEKRSTVVCCQRKRSTVICYEMFKYDTLLSRKKIHGYLLSEERSTVICYKVFKYDTLLSRKKIHGDLYPDVSDLMRCCLRA
ncbi:hypothetical protein DPMN_033957 [Dreissena polymorpha]|uniref:Uncharacterized protein n=1 Tax=Dreissena polymorpha TaxID=45954 RepID=A0A9D4RLH2_DREPO|nr:hypothetical protein DPMN_033957 [Dreissena polymorpha]